MDQEWSGVLDCVCVALRNSLGFRNSLTANTDWPLPAQQKGQSENNFREVVVSVLKVRK